MASAVLQQVQRDGVVCPTQLRHGLFTVGALDNIDYNPSSTSAEGSFHGTCISLIQSPSKNKMGEHRPSVTLSASDQGENLSLPDSYTVVPAVSLKEASVQVPTRVNPGTIVADMRKAKQEELQWIATATEHLSKDKLDAGDTVAWAAFHASLDTSDQD